MIELEIDGQPVRGPRGRDDPRRCRQLGIDTPTLCYGDTLAAGERLPRLRRRGRGRARARAGLLAQGRGRAWWCRPTPSACATRARWCSSCSRRRSTSRRRRSAEAYLERYDAEPERYGPPAPPDPDRDRKRTGHHDEPDGQTRRHRARAGEGRQRPLRARLLEVHPLLQVRRRVRRAVPEHLRDPVAGRGFDARISTEYVDRAARVGLRLLRQLHRRLPDRRADVPLRARAARAEGDWREDDRR